MNHHLFEELLHEEEGPSLDFKREQYRFNSCDDEARSELLKDILAFANAWRRSDAYILIGVEEVKGSRCIIIGISNQLDDANLQQFINSKTQRPVNFSYEAFLVDGKSVGIIRIPPQKRPFFCRKNYGKVKANEVYIRRGSSTALADPDEIAIMGEAVAVTELKEPTLDLEFADITLRKALGVNPSLKSEFLEPLTAPKRQYPPFMMTPEVLEVLSDNGYRDKLIKHVASTAPFVSIGFRIHNSSHFPALDVRVELSAEKEDGLFYWTKMTIPFPLQKLISTFPDPPSFLVETQ